MNEPNKSLYGVGIVSFTIYVLASQLIGLWFKYEKADAKWKPGNLKQNNCPKL